MTQLENEVAHVGLAAMRKYLHYDDWRTRRYEIAKQVLPKCIELVNNTLMSGRSITENNPAKQAAHMATIYADALIDELTQTYEK